MERPRVVCLDTVMIDFSLRVVALPPRGGDALSNARLVTAGGGFNLMSAVRRQGGDVVYAGQLGRGRFAEIATSTLDGEGIILGVPARGDEDLGVCVVLVEANGERTFITSPGAELTLSEVDLAMLEVGVGDVVYVSGYNFVYPQLAPTVSTWLDNLRPDVKVAFDPGPRAADIDHDLMAMVLRRTDWLLCNAAEARHLIGHEATTRSASELRRSWGCELVVVRDGARGCVVADGEGVTEIPGFATTVVDTNGAGDVHNGVVIAELLRSARPQEASRRANAAAAIAIAHFGSATCPTREAVDHLLAQ
jgi:ribokinase